MSNFIFTIDNNLVISLLVSFIGGIISSFSPCTISTIPLIIGYLNIDSTKGKKKSNVIYSISFSIGIVIVFVILGIVSTVLGKNFRMFGRLWYIFLGIVLMLVSLKLFNVFSVNKSCKRPVFKKGVIGAFFLGIVGGFFESPCSTPILIAILAFISQTQNILYGILLMIFYSIGHCIIILIAGISVDTITKFTNNDKYFKFNKIIKIIFGLICVVFSMYLFYLGF